MLREKIPTMLVQRVLLAGRIRTLRGRACEFAGRPYIAAPAAAGRVRRGGGKRTAAERLPSACGLGPPPRRGRRCGVTGVRHPPGAGR